MLLFRDSKVVMLRLGMIIDLIRITCFFWRLGMIYDVLNLVPGLMGLVFVNEMFARYITVVQLPH